MPDSRKKNTIRNFIWGISDGLVQVLLPFVTRAIILYLLGANYLGIGTLFTSVLQFLSLAELGVGSAITYTMYRPIADGDIESLGRILNYIKKIYRIIGLSMLCIGTILVPAIPFLIRGDVPADINIYLLYYIYLINTVISYFFAGYRECLLTAYQRRDMTIKWVTVISIIIQFTQIVVLVLTKNFYVYAFVPIIGTIATNCVNIHITRRMYPAIIPHGEINYELRVEIKRKLSGLIGTKLSSVVHHSSDTIVISVFLGLTYTAQYGNYYLVLYSICGFIATLYTSMTASIGDKLVRDSLDENYKLFQYISFANNWLVAWCTIMFVCLLEPLIAFAYGRQMCLGVKFDILMGIYLYIYQIQKVLLTFKDAAGIWYSDRFRPYVIMITNLVSNLLLVNLIGIYGIVISTILSLLLSLPWLNFTLYDKLFHRTSWKNLFSMLGNGILTIVICWVMYMICGLFYNDLTGLVVKVGVCVVLPNILFLLIYWRTENFRYWRGLIAKSIKKYFRR